MQNHEVKICIKLNLEKWFDQAWRISFFPCRRFTEILYAWTSYCRINVHPSTALVPIYQCKQARSELISWINQKQQDSDQEQCFIYSAHRILSRHSHVHDYIRVWLVLPPAVPRYTNYKYARQKITDTTVIRGLQNCFVYQYLACMNKWNIVRPVQMHPANYVDCNPNLGCVRTTQINAADLNGRESSKRQYVFLCAMQMANSLARIILHSMSQRNYSAAELEAAIHADFSHTRCPRIRSHV